MKRRSVFTPYLAVFGALLWLALQSGCSPVAFTNEPTPSCTVDNPCNVGPNSTSAQVTQTVTFSNTNKVDVLVVVDNSNSYATDDQSLGSPLNGFINHLNSTGMDWQIGVTTTDVCPQADASSSLCPAGDNGSQGLIVGPSIAQTSGSTTYATGSQYIIRPGLSAGSEFNSTVVRNDGNGTKGYPSGDERAIFAANLAIDNAGSGNAGFFRSNSNLAVVIISNEDERSVGGLIPTDPAYAPLTSYDLPQTLLNKVSTVWGGTKSLKVNTIAINPNDTTCFNTQDAADPDKSVHYANIYTELPLLTMGAIESICAPSYELMLENITGAISQFPTTNVVALNYIPTATPTITFSPVGNATNYIWNPGTNQVTFTNRPANGTQVSFTYTFAK